MNCLRKKVSILSVFLISFGFLSMFSTSAGADYTSISLSPSTGTIYADSTAISVLVNSGTAEFVGVDVNLAFTGSVEYITSSGASRCSSFLVTEGSGTINIECLSTAHAEGETYSGVIATLYFKSTGTGTSTFTFSSTDPNIATKNGGTYTLSLENNPNSTDSNTDGTLPDSGIFDDNKGIIAIGIGLIAFGLFFNQITNIGYSLLGKAKDVKLKRAEEKVAKRRNKLEKKF